MEIGMREWLIVIGALLLLAVLIDGFRRMRKSRSDTLRMSKGMLGGGFDKVADATTVELPHGGARVVGIRNPDTGAIQPVEADPLLDEPDLDNLSYNSAVDLLEDEEIYARREDFDPEFMVEDSLAGNSSATQEDAAAALIAAAEDASVKGAKTSSADRGSQGSSSGKSFKQSFNLTRDKNNNAKPAANNTVAEQICAAAAAPQIKISNEFDEVIVISVVAKQPGGFKGEQLFNLLTACGMHIGDMDIFHRYEYDSGDGPIQFSVANMVKPGNFPAIGTATFSTPGVTFFLGLPGPDDPMKAFDYMFETARCVAKNLNGELKDELRSVMTSQTIEHSRQRVRDFERMQLSVRNV